MALRKLLTFASESTRFAARSEIFATTVRSMATNKCVSQKSGCGRSLDNMVVPTTEVVRFIRDCMVKAGTSCEDADIVAHHLMTADYRGHFSHGLNRLQMYVKEINLKITDPAAKPEICKDFQAIALVDGQNGMGQVVGKFCMELAMEKANNFGIGMVVAKGSNHYGICGYYTLMAMECGMIGFTCTNTSPLMVPTRGKDSALGTNPISFGMAAAEGDQFVLDMATTAVALGKIELAQRKNTEIPHGWAMDCNGLSTTDPKVALEHYKLYPLGGEEKNSGYKGTGLAVMVEVLCGILADAAFGPNIRRWGSSGKEKANLGHCFIAINPDCFAPGAGERLACLLKQLREAPQLDKCSSIMVAGDPERYSMEKVDKQGGIKYHKNQIQNSEQFAKEIGVPPMQLVQMKSPESSSC